VSKNVQEIFFFSASSRDAELDISVIYNNRETIKGLEDEVPVVKEMKDKAKLSSCFNN